MIYQHFLIEITCDHFSRASIAIFIEQNAGGKLSAIIFAS